MNVISGKQQAGVALIIVLWMLALLTIMTFSYSTMARNEAKVTTLTVNKAKVRALAEAGVWIAVDELLKQKQDKTWPHDGTEHKVSMGMHTISVSLQDQNGMIDLNSAAPELLQSLLQKTVPDHADVLVDAILDWRDADNLSLNQNAESEAGAKNNVFNHIGELQRLAEIPPEIYKQLEPALTVHSHQTGINLNTAPKEVLMMLPNVDEGNIDAIMDARQQGDTDELSMLYAIDTSYLTNLEGPVFAIHSMAKVHDFTASLVAMVQASQLKHRPYSILSWSFK